MLAAPTDRETILVLDYGSQYSQLIVRRVREQHVYCEMIPWDAPAAQISRPDVQGLILSGGPNSVYDLGAPDLPRHILDAHVPILGICYGAQLLARHFGGHVGRTEAREYGAATVAVEPGQSALFADVSSPLDVWMSHGDRIESLPEGFVPLAHSESSPYAAFAAQADRIYGLQFHPEVVHTPQGGAILRSFCQDVCGCAGTWTTGAFIKETIDQIRARVGDDRVLCAVSGGVDSTVVATLVAHAIGSQLVAVFVNNGLLRKGEAQENMARFAQHLDAEVRYVDAASEFLDALAGITDPEQKRVTIGHKFIEVFEHETRGLGSVRFLAQGTLYPDVIESATPANKSAARIKTHHNVGGLPDHMNMELIEPLRFLFKDEVRQVGLDLGLPDEMVFRAPFPGPGLAVRIIGEVTAERVAVLQEADAIVRHEVEAAGLDREIWQYFAVLTPLRSVGVMGDGRTYAHVVAVRAVTSEDG